MHRRIGEDSLVKLLRNIYQMANFKGKRVFKCISMRNAMT